MINILLLGVMIVVFLFIVYLARSHFTFFERTLYVYGFTATYKVLFIEIIIRFTDKLQMYMVKFKNTNCFCTNATMSDLIASYSLQQQST